MIPGLSCVRRNIMTVFRMGRWCAGYVLMAVMSVKADMAFAGAE